LELAVGQTLFLRGEYSEAIGYLDKAIAEGTLVPEASTWKAAALYKMGQSASAEQLLNQAAGQDAKYRDEYQSLIKVTPVTRNSGKM
jgi:Tfp pilus assembly protein PilF